MDIPSAGAPPESCLIGLRHAGSHDSWIRFLLPWFMIAAMFDWGLDCVVKNDLPGNEWWTDWVGRRIVERMAFVSLCVRLIGSVHSGTVSYTHLDVYKRQVEGRGSLLRF